MAAAWSRFDRDARQSSAAIDHEGHEAVEEHEVILTQDPSWTSIPFVNFVVPGRYMPLYCGPPPPSGGTQVITWYGSMMSHVLQCTQFDALICSRWVPSSPRTMS